MAAASCPVALAFFSSSCILLLLQTICCSGVFVELSYDSTQVKVQPFACRDKPCGSESTAGSFISDVLGPDRRLNVSGIVVTATGTRQLGALLRTLRSLQASLGDAGLAERVKVSPELSMSSLRVVGKDLARATKKRRWGKVLEFVRRTRSLVFVRVDTEAGANGEVVAVIEEAAAQVAAVLGADVGVVLHIKSRAVPSAAAMEKLTGRGEKRSLGVLVDVSFPRRDRELGEARATAHDEFSPVSNPATTPVSNPVTVPATNPVANPMSPGFVTVPSTNPGNGFASNTNLPPLYPEPTTAPVTMPTPDPTTTMPPPVTVPSPFANPVAAPTTTMPGTVTNPATTPSQFPPVTNPVTTYPYPQQGGMPGTTPEVYQPPATTTPGTAQQSAPSVTGQGQAWCVAKSGLMDAALQDGIDYACGAGGADCSAIQPMGTCYNPNTLQAHASYAFNSYFQRNPSATSCDFGGAGMLVNVNPSSGTCVYQTSAGFGAGYSPGTTTGGGGVPSGYTPGMPGAGYGAAGGGVSGTMGGGSGSTVLNANNPGGNSMYGGYDNTAGLTAGSAPLPCGGGGWAVLCLVWMVTFAFVKEKV
ncbi:uncharacterized protein [Zea mays]|uniref:X8 domain-containing protein n=1 Tax=Zea mays TaxID=4577 RepID=C0P551_MAIZE|nr:uncharacterized protein LOC100274879 isoform X2 [Zea mays]ACN28117.1 unknown [Zea mays]|eukprot:XP_008681581.1 uncharacterized protein LOC100274879 isoform X2 [Zea mays]